MKHGNKLDNLGSGAPGSQVGVLDFVSMHRVWYGIPFNNEQF
jgi:hypothetical protein